MTHCIQCHRPMKRAGPSGMGPVCSKRFAAPVLAHDRDLFGYDTAKAQAAALQRIAVGVESLAADAHAGFRAACRDARVQAGVWAR